MIKAVVFDLDGVYFLHGTQRFLETVATRFNVDPEQVKQLYLRSEQMQQYKKGLIGDETYWNWFVRELAIETTIEELLQILPTGYEVSAEAVALNKELRAQGIKTAICTNNFPARIKVLNAKFNFLQDFDVVVCSYDQGSTKPDPQIFEALTTKLGLPKAQIYMSDDRSDNVAALKQLGFSANLYLDFKTFKLDLENHGLNLNY
jgi:putative hydrolase of the HAD superfamily